MAEQVEPMDVADTSDAEIMEMGKKLISLIDNKALKIKSEDLNSYTPFNTINAKHRDLQDQFFQQCLSTTKGDRLLGCMVGMGVADAVGHPFEFLPVVDKPGEYVFKLGQYTKEHNAFNLQRGQWTDARRWACVLLILSSVCKSIKAPTYGKGFGTGGTMVTTTLSKTTRRGTTVLVWEETSPNHSVTLAGSAVGPMTNLTRYTTPEGGILETGR